MQGRIPPGGSGPEGDEHVADSPESALTLTSQFWVEIQGITQAYFKECSGMQIATETEKIKEGGLNNYVHMLPTRATQSNVTLKRGIMVSDDIYAWYSDVLKNKIERRTVTIYIYSNSGLAEGKPLVTWTLLNALPVKYVAPSFKADESAVAVDSVEFAFGELKRTKVG
jgi:phage tail-like protein